MSKDILSNSVPLFHGKKIRNFDKNVIPNYSKQRHLLLSKKIACNAFLCFYHQDASSSEDSEGNPKPKKKENDREEDEEMQEGLGEGEDPWNVLVKPRRISNALLKGMLTLDPDVLAMIEAKREEALEEEGGMNFVKDAEVNGNFYQVLGVKKYRKRIE